MSPFLPGVWPCSVPGWPADAPAVRVLAVAQERRVLAADAADADGRSAARQRVREVLAHHAGAGALVHLRTSSRQAPAPGPVTVSHGEGVSLLAWCAEGCLGIDLVDLAPLAVMPREERRALASLYLGEALDEVIPLAHAWARHEARLKCLGLGLQEWRVGDAAALAACAAWPVAWPHPWAETPLRRVAWLAWRRSAA